MDFIKYEPNKNIIDNFSCGNIIIDNYINSENKNSFFNGVNYILYDDNKNVIGFFNLIASELIGYSQGIQYPMGGSITIQYFAIDKKYQHKKINNKFSYGDYLMQKCEDVIRNIYNKVGFSFVLINSTEDGYSFYKRNGYEEFEQDMYSISDEADKKCYKLYKTIEDIL